MQCACAVFSSVGCPALKYFFHFTRKRYDFRKKFFLTIKSVLWFSLQLLSEKILILKKNWTKWWKMYISPHVQCPIILVRFLWNLIFLDRFSKNIQISNFLKMRAVGTLLHADGRTDEETDMTNLIVAFRNFENAPKNRLVLDHSIKKVGCVSLYW
jgi:hypothetical protein